MKVQLNLIIGLLLAIVVNQVLPTTKTTEAVNVTQPYSVYEIRDRMTFSANEGSSEGFLIDKGDGTLELVYPRKFIPQDCKYLERRIWSNGEVRYTPLTTDITEL